MKTIFRVLALGIFTAAAAVSSFAQDACADTFEVKTALYQKFKDGLRTAKTSAEVKTVLDTGKEFVSKYGACEDSKAVVDYINKKIPDVQVAYDKISLTDRFNNSIKDPKNVNASEAFATGKEFIAKNPDLMLDSAIVLASIGYDNSAKATPINTYNSDAVNYAKMAIQQIESGKTSKTYGAYGYSFAVKDAQGKIDPVKSKENALAYMNYYIASILYYNQNMKKDALPYFYKASQYNASVKDKPGVYQAIGAWYLEELLAMDAKRLEKVKANGDQENDETKAMFAMEKGYADRAIDAYARAYKLASADPKTDAAYKTGLYEKLQGLYKLRFDKTDGIDAYVSTVMSKPMPNPLTAVTPVADETPATTSSTTTPTTTTTTTNPSTKPPTTNNTTTTKPSTTSTTTNKPTASTMTKTTTTNGAGSSNAKTTTKTTTVKKKGNR